MKARKLSRFSKRLLIVAACSFFIIPSIAAVCIGNTYYVAVNGSDSSGDGGSAHPWATISHATGDVPDGSLILVRPGLYQGPVRLRGVFNQGIIVRSEVPYRAMLRNNGTVVMCYEGIGITLEGFDIAHDGPGADALVMQIADTIGEPGGDEYVSRITIRNNVLHDSYNNDILKVNNGCRNIVVEGNLFYNQTGSDEHIDANSVTDVVIQDNIFMNDFAGSGRPHQDTSSFIVIKDSDGDDDGQLGSERVTVRRNVFLHYEGGTDNGFVRVGEDGTANFEAKHVLIENNLMIGNNTDQMRSPFQFWGVQDVTARANTVVGNMPAREFGMRFGAYESNPNNDGLHLHNNIWADPTGSMGEDFNQGRETDNFTFDNNLFWNAGNAFPPSPDSFVDIEDDVHRVVANPRLGSQSGLILPRWNPAQGHFADGSASIRDAFVRLVTLYGTPDQSSPAIDAGDPDWSPTEDILRHPRIATPDIGAVENAPTDAEKDEDVAPSHAQLAAYPNPFNPKTTLSWRADSPVREIAVFDIDGRKLKTLLAGPVPGHSGEVVWDGRDEAGQRAASAVYVIRLRTQRETIAFRVVLVK